MYKLLKIHCEYERDSRKRKTPKWSRLYVLVSFDIILGTMMNAI